LKKIFATLMMIAEYMKTLVWPIPLKKPRYATTKRKKTRPMNRHCI